MKFIPLIAASILCAACEKPAIDPSQSLVGAKHLPSAKMLSRESIQITRGSGETAPVLSYELRPDNSLKITYSPNDSTRSKPVGLFHLRPNVAASARRALWRLRPERLEGLGPIIAPANCPPSPIDSFPDAAVAFIAEGPEPGTSDDQVGIFALPSARVCSSIEAGQARRLLRAVIESLPIGNVPRGVSDWSKDF